MTSPSHWQSWHGDYADPGSSLSRRRRCISGHIDAWLDSCPGRPLRVVSACAGDGRDLLDVLDRRDDAERVHAVLLETDPVLVHRAQQGAPGTVQVRCVDAGRTDSYAAAVPADLVMICGVFGNISDADVLGMVDVLPQLCSQDATVIWTRARREPDLTPAIRRWLSDAGFDEVAFEAPDDVQFTVGVHRLVVPPQALACGRRMFTFVG